MQATGKPAGAYEGDILVAADGIHSAVREKLYRDEGPPIWNGRILWRGVTAGDATIAGYAHESGRSVVIVINKWDLVTRARNDGKPPADRKIYEEQVRRHLKFLAYAPAVFVSAASGENIDKLFSTLKLVARERRKRIGTGEMNRFLHRVDFERASVPMSKRVKVLYMTQAAVSPPTFILFTDRAVKLHFSYQRFLENQIRAAFGFVGTPIWIKNRARG